MTLDEIQRLQAGDRVRFGDHPGTVLLVHGYHAAAWVGCLTVHWDDGEVSDIDYDDREQLEHLRRA